MLAPNAFCVSGGSPPASGANTLVSSALFGVVYPQDFRDVTDSGINRGPRGVSRSKTVAATWKCRNNTATAEKKETMATKKRKFKVGMKVEWVGRGGQYRQGIITKIFANPKIGDQPLLAIVQPEEVGVSLNEVKVVK